MSESRSIRELFAAVGNLQSEIRRIVPVKVLAPPAMVIKLEDLLKDSELERVTGKLFRDGHHARAVEEAFKLLNNIVKKAAKLEPGVDGSSLMKRAFGPSGSVLKINGGETQSEKDEQLGYMEIFSGVMTGIRNPRAHEHDWEDTQERALELLLIADHLIAKVRNSSKFSKGRDT